MPVSLEVLELSFGKFTGGIPAEWSSMTNLKELRMNYCGLDGESCITKQTQRMTRETGEQDSEPFLPSFPARSFTGTIPASIGGLSSLQTLNLMGNALSGICFVLCRFR